jgi:recombinational DNA repair ATPase RecF
MTLSSDSSSEPDPISPPSFHSELEAWSTDRAVWQRYALWMLATKAELTSSDFDALEGSLMREVGLSESAEQKETLFEAAHLKSKAAADVRLLAVSKIGNVNRLDPKGITFAPSGLTIVYGDNGSGKTGFIRVLRKACRSRIEKPQELEILANVYGSVGGVATAHFTIQDGSAEDTIEWIDGGTGDRRLSAFSVFDTRSAQLYVDEGNKLRFLPADLDLPFRLNDVIQRVEEKLGPQLTQTLSLLAAYVVPFDEAERNTGARKFFSELTNGTTDAAIDEACLFTAENQTDLDGLVHALSAGPDRVIELKRSATAARTLAQRIKGLNDALADPKRTTLKYAWTKTISARLAHETSKALVDGKDPLPGVGSDVWAHLWKAAQDYAAAADVHHHFPESGPKGAGDHALCPLCQQPTASVAERLGRFESFVSSTTATAITAAEVALKGIRDGLSAANPTLSEAEIILLDSVRSLDDELATVLGARFAAAGNICSAWLAYDGSGEFDPALDETDLVTRLSAAADRTDALAQTVAEAQDEAARAILVERRNELQDRRSLSACGPVLKDRRNTLKRQKGLKAAEASCRRTEVTKQANKWVDIHLTNEAKRLFTDHLKEFKLQHLNVELERQSSSVGTGYKNTIQGGKGFKRVSDVLSEGEQRALSLAAFFTEAELERPGGTLIVDDPVSSLDRLRSAAVARQLVKEAKTRQVIVFTHDLMFLEELGEAGKSAALEPQVARVFSTPAIAGLLDPSGSAWKGQNVKSRIGYLKNKLPELKGLETTSRTDYEVAVKALYGRLRDAYERLVEEKLFHNVVTRFRSAIQTRELRFVSVPDDVAKQFHLAFTKASLHSHDNPSAADITPPDTAEISFDLDALVALVADIDIAQKAAEAARPEMA